MIDKPRQQARQKIALWMLWRQGIGPFGCRPPRSRRPDRGKAKTKTVHEQQEKSHAGGWVCK